MPLHGFHPNACFRRITHIVHFIEQFVGEESTKREVYSITVVIIQGTGTGNSTKVHFGEKKASKPREEKQGILPCQR